MKTLLNFGVGWLIAILIMALIFFLLAGCSIFPQKQIQQATEISKLTAKEQTTVYITKIQTSPLTVICWVGIGLGFFAFLSGNGWGLKLMASCAVVICGALILASATAWIAVATKWLILLAICAAAVATVLLLYAIFVKGRALREIIGNVEDIKKISSIPNTKVDPDAPIGINTILKKQSSSTKAVVASIKKNLVPAK